MGAAEAQSGRIPDDRVEWARIERVAHAAVAATDPRTMLALEQHGLGLATILEAPGDSTRAMMRTEKYRALVEVLDADLRELGDRPTVGGDDAPNHAFKASWLRSSRTRFELVGVVNRLDRRFAEPGTCGEVRLVYRLALTPAGRPVTRLPMTINLHFPQHGDCGAIARRWLGVAPGGTERVAGLLERVREASPVARVEVDVQNLHGPALRIGEDDHAEYLLRTFETKGQTLVPRLLVNTPRPDLSLAERADLAAWIVQHFAEVDEGTAVLPDRFLATRAISVTPRGLARPRNRVFRSLFEQDATATRTFDALPFAGAKVVGSTRALLRRLDEGTCNGCHQSRAVAGFHLLGEERDPDVAFNALAVGRSPHFLEELGWREAFVRSVAGEGESPPRPFAGHARNGVYGAHCGLGDAGFAGFTCGAHLRCRDTDGDELGTCVSDDGNQVGDACENARIVFADTPDGDRILPGKKEGCDMRGAHQTADACSPNAYGFAGGLCSEECATLGVVEGAAICTDIPTSGYESECFLTPQPIEQCLLTHVARRWVRTCDAENPCRDDYGCARVSGAPAGIGACVPPYFVFQARVDGPALDR